MEFVQCGRSGKDRRRRQAREPERRLGLTRRKSDIVPIQQIRSGKDRRQRHPACSFAVPERRLRLSRRQVVMSNQTNRRPLSPNYILPYSKKPPGFCLGAKLPPGRRQRVVPLHYRPVWDNCRTEQRISPDQVMSFALSEM